MSYHLVSKANHFMERESLGIDVVSAFQQFGEIVVYDESNLTSWDSQYVVRAMRDIGLVDQFHLFKLEQVGICDMNAFREYLGYSI